MSPPCPGNPKFPGKKLPETEQGAQTDAPRELDNRHARAKTRGDLRETLDLLLTPRNRQKKAGRAKGSQNYNWSPAADAILVELVSELELSKAKRAIFHRLEVFHGNAARTRLDAYRKAIERRMAKLGLPAGESRRIPRERNARPWTEAQTKALIGSLGEDVSLDTVAKRTGHSVKAVRAKMARLGYTIADIPGFTTHELAALLGVTHRRIGRWKEKRWLETKNHRLTEEDFEEYCQISRLSCL